MDQAGAGDDQDDADSGWETASDASEGASLAHVTGALEHPATASSASLQAHAGALLFAPVFAV